MTSSPDRGSEGALLTPLEAAALLRISTSTLAKWRMHGKGPDYVKLGQAVRYTPGALGAWIGARCRTRTAHEAQSQNGK